MSRSALAAIVALYLAATLPALDRFPPIEAAQAGIAAPAWHLATTGVYGNPLYEGFHRNESRNYEYLPVYPLLVAGSYRLFGLGAVPARAVSVAAGLAILLLTFALGRRLHGDAGGVLAAFVLVTARLWARGQGCGVPLLDMARWIRYDILVPVFVLAACLVFLRGVEERRLSIFALAGGLAGLAALTHVWGAFVIPLLLLVLVFEDRPLRPALALLGGFAATLLPWIAYVCSDLPAFLGQMTRHEDRFDLSPSALVSNLVRERHRYAPWLFDSAWRLDLFPRPGLVLVAAGVGLATVRLVRAQRRTAAERLVLLSLPVLGLLLALLVSPKRPPYAILLLPFLAVQAGALVRHRAAAAALALAAAAESAPAVTQMLEGARATASSAELGEALARHVPPGARILGLHHYWLALPRPEFRSLDLAWHLADPGTGQARTPGFEEVVASLDPEVLLVPEELRAEMRTDAARRERPRAIVYWDQLEALLGSGRFPLAATVRAEGYGTIGIYRRGSPR